MRWGLLSILFFTNLAHAQAPFACGSLDFVVSHPNSFYLLQMDVEVQLTGMETQAATAVVLEVANEVRIAPNLAARNAQLSRLGNRLSDLQGESTALRWEINRSVTAPWDRERLWGEQNFIDKNTRPIGADKNWKPAAIGKKNLSGALRGAQGRVNEVLERYGARTLGTFRRLVSNNRVIVGLANRISTLETVAIRLRFLKWTTRAAGIAGLILLANDVIDLAAKPLGYASLADWEADPDALADNGFLTREKKCEFVQKSETLRAYFDETAARLLTFEHLLATGEIEIVPPRAPPPLLARPGGEELRRSQVGLSDDTRYRPPAAPNAPARNQSR